MVQALIKSDSSEFIDLVQDWSKQNGLITSQKTSSTISVVNKRFLILWQFNGANHSLDVKMTARPRLYLSVLFNLTMLGTLLFVIQSLLKIINEYNGTNLLNFCMYVFLFIVMFWYKYHYFWLELTGLENSFWQHVQNSVDTKILSRPNGQLESSKSRFLTESLFSFAAIYICTITVGIYGFLVSFILCFYFMILIWTHILKDKDMKWHWHFWIIGNMSRWIFVNIAILAFAVVLIAVEIITPLRLCESENNPSIAEVLHHGRFRTITDHSALVLENDAKKYTYDLSRFQTKDKESYEFSLYFNCVFQLVIFCLGLVFFSFIPLSGILKSKKVWQKQVVEVNHPPVPFVPYLNQSWQQETPLNLMRLVVFHALIGGIINVAAGIFCIESLEYIIFGKCHILSNIANLWSWVFAPCKIIFGEVYGQKIGMLFVFIVCSPQVLLFAAYIRRLVIHVIMTLRVLWSIHFLNAYKEKHLYLYDYVRQICINKDIKTPSIIITRCRGALLNVSCLPFIGRQVIVISKGTVDILDPDEMNATLAHELGHIKKGIWKISLLKLLSSIALFPNYYLTLCMDWAKKEMEADQFALEVTGDAQSLKHALIKMSTAQITSFEEIAIFGNITKLFTNRAYSLYYAIQYFFGDSLFGYVHPYLSERLEAIDANAKREK